VVSLEPALQAAEKLLSFVGRAFRRAIKTTFSAGVLTPEVEIAFFATRLAGGAQFRCSSMYATELVAVPPMNPRDDSRSGNIGRNIMIEPGEPSI
jgi:hypothetical protein